MNSDGSHQTIYPALRYRDAHAAIAWLTEAFGFDEHAVHEADGRVAHAELTLGGAIIMLGSEHGDGAPLGLRAGNGMTYIAVDDPDAMHERATAAGAKVIVELADTDYDSREFTVADLEGNLWSFGTYRP